MVKTQTGTQEKKKNTRTASYLTRLATEGTVPGFVPEEESRPHKADEQGVIWVDIDHLLDSPYQHAEQIDPEEYQALVTSMSSESIQFALNVTEVEGRPGYYYLTAGGHQRRNAARDAGKRKLPVFVGPPLDPQRLAFRAAKENAVRVNLSPVNLGYLFLQMQSEFGLSQEAIAAELGKGRNFVNFCIMAANSAPDIQAMLLEKPDSLRAMSYLRRIKPVSEQPSQEELERAAALRAPIIAQFLANEISTDGVLEAVEALLAGEPEGIATREMTSNNGSAGSKNAGSKKTRSAVSAQVHTTGDSRALERLGRLSAVLSRLRSYKKLLGAAGNVSEEESRLLQEIEEELRTLQYAESGE